MTVARNRRGLYGRRGMEENEVIIEHPNREKAASRATKGVVLILLLISVGLMLIVTIGGWDALQGAKPVQIAYILLYLIIAFYVARWNRGVLPVAAALAILLLIFAAVAVPGWYDRDHDGFEQPAINAGVLGLITALIIPVQVLLIAFAMRAFGQAWNVEVERTPAASAA
jgi:energy-coupling factor transporter transmembrane protein EcfT